MATYRLNQGLVERVAAPGSFVQGPVELVDVPSTPEVQAELTLDTAQAALTPTGALTDSTATNPTDDDFNQAVAEIVTALNVVIAALQDAGILDAS